MVNIGYYFEIISIGILMHFRKSTILDCLSYLITPVAGDISGDLFLEQSLDHKGYSKFE